VTVTTVFLNTDLCLVCFMIYHLGPLAGREGPFGCPHLHGHAATGSEMHSC
jgi:hypothetical protein